jgi:hypothetical protein
VRDKNTGKVGTLIHEFEVPDLAQLRLSSPVISDALQPASDPSIQGPPRPAPLARRVFVSGGTLFCQYEVYGAAKDKANGLPKVSAGYVVRRTDGTVFTQMAPSTITPTSIGKLSRLIGTPLDGASPGDYEVVLSVKDELSGKTVEVHEPFHVESPS